MNYVKSALLCTCFIFISSCGASGHDVQSNEEDSVENRRVLREKLTQRGIIVWGASASRDDRWMVDDYDMGPVVMSMFADSEQLSIDDERLTAFGWPEGLAVPRDVAEWMRIDVLPLDREHPRVSAHSDFFIDLEQVGDVMHRQAMVDRMLVKQDFMLTLYVGIMALPFNHQAIFGETRFTLRLSEGDFDRDELEDVMTKLDSALESKPGLRLDLDAGISAISIISQGDDPKIQSSGVERLGVLMLPVRYLKEADADTIARDMSRLSNPGGFRKPVENRR